MFRLNTTAAHEFESKRLKYPSQVFAKKEENINSLLKDNEEAISLEKISLTKEEAWQGLKWKAETPEKYIPVKESIIVPDSRKLTEYGESFIRLSIQPSFATGNLVVVKEDIHIDENEKRIYFLGREVDVEQAKKYLQQIDDSMLLEKPALFHVEHAVKGSDDTPIATWKMVRLSDIDSQDEEEAQRILGIKNLVASFTGTKIYLQTIRQMSEAGCGNDRPKQ